MTCCLALFLLSGCATMPPPVDTVNRAHAAIREAVESGAEAYAPLELKFAREKLTKARAAMHKEAYQRAKRAAEKALINALLAEAKADSAVARKAAAKARENVKALRRELLGSEGSE